MKVNPRTVDQLIQAYSLQQQGMSQREISQKLGIPSSGTVSVSLRTLEKYLNGTARTQSRQWNNYKTAARLIRKQRSSSRQGALTPEAPVSPETKRPDVALWPATPPIEDPFAFLRSSFETFQQAVATFIEVEISTRYKALQDEIRVLREENEQFKQKLSEPQSINWIDTLEESLPKESQ